jgi:AraC-like DNA-binding protein
MPRLETMSKKVRKKSAKAGAVTPQARTHVGRVNQKMIDQMIHLRREGFTHADIARRLGASERTVRRHTEGVSPHLVHASDEKRVDLLTWGALQMRVIQQRWRLTVSEFDIALKALRTAVSQLDDMTVEQLEGDNQLRVQFLLHEVWPPAHEKIDDLRLSQDLPTTFKGA